MNYVIDSSVGLKWVLPEIDSDKALRLLADYAVGIHQLLAPDFFPTEIANALASAEKSAHIQPGQAVLFLTDILNNSPVIHEATPLLRRALEISLPTRHSVYDCLYVALAERETCNLVTADTRLVKVLGPQFPFIIELSSL
jgi:predicted nucleic acid-binding protein